jgi:hypothetical protein
MTATLRAALIACFFAAIGLLAVYLEVEHTRCGVRIQNLYRARDAALESIRRLEVRYNQLMSPDVLERRLAEDLAALQGSAEGEGEGSSEALEPQPVFLLAPGSRSGG